MTKVVVYTNKTGGMSVLIPAKNVCVPIGIENLARSHFWTPASVVTEPPKGHRFATLEEIAARDVPAGVEWRVVDRDNLPQDRCFRNAWVQQQGAVSVHMDKAREIHKSNLRIKRAEAMRLLDIEYMNADEVGDIELKQATARKKQALRDITTHPSILSAQTPEDLKMAGTEVLK